MVGGVRVMEMGVGVAVEVVVEMILVVVLKSAAERAWLLQR